MSDFSELAFDVAPEVAAVVPLHDLPNHRERPLLPFGARSEVRAM